MSWNEKYNEEDILKDYTKPLSKIWDNLMPTTYPYVQEFKTKKAVEVETVKLMGPYHMTERFIDYDCYVKIDRKPLIDYGWKGEPITKDLWKKVYGKSYFHDLRGQMVKLSAYAGLNLSQFDFGGNIKAEVDDL